MEETIVLVVGAGPAGLGIAACLTKKSIPHIILEKEDCCASLWKKRTYDRCHLHLAKEFCSLPLKPHAPHAKKYLGKDDFIDYIDEYVSEFDIRPRYFKSVESASFDEATGKWLVETKNTLQKVTIVFVASFLVIATGENGKGYIPDIPGLKDFKGDVLHSSEYKSGREFKDKNVLVVGCGNSGMQISYDLCIWEPPLQLLLEIRLDFLAPNFLSTKFVHVVTREIVFVGMHLLKYFSFSIVDPFITFASKLMYGNLSKYGIHRPNEGPFFLKATKGRSPVIDVGTIDKIQFGEIKVLPRIASINKSKVIFEDKVELEFDAIIFATGYKSTTCEWLKDYDNIIKDDGFPKNRFPNHWKGKNGLYCTGLSRMGLQGISKDAIVIANDIDMVLKTMVVPKDF